MVLEVCAALAEWTMRESQRDYNPSVVCVGYNGTAIGDGCWGATALRGTTEPVQSDVNERVVPW